MVSVRTSNFKSILHYARGGKYIYLQIPKLNKNLKGNQS